jgi:hypothetical protein
MRRKLSVSFALSLGALSAATLTLASATASAQSAVSETAVQASASPDPLAKENWPLSMVDRPLGVSAHMLQVDVNSATSLTKDYAGKPSTLPLAVWYGVTNQLQVGLVHASGLCISGESNGCAKVYDDVAFNALYSISGRGGNFELAGWAQLNYSSFDRGTINAQVGPAINWVIAGNAALLAYPGIQFGLDKREEMANKEALVAPVYLYGRAGAHVAPVLFTGISAPFDGFSDSYRVPVGVGALVGLTTKIDVGARFDLSNLLGKHAEGVGAADERALLVWVSVRPL